MGLGLLGLLGFFRVFFLGFFRVWISIALFRVSPPKPQNPLPPFSFSDQLQTDTTIDLETPVVCLF